MRNMFIAFVLSIASLSAIAGPRFGHWIVSDDSSYMYNHVYEADGKQSVITVNKAGFVSLSVVPKGYKSDKGSFVTGNTKGVVTVNGVRVNFEFDSYSDGMTLVYAKSDKGNTHLQNVLWSANRINFIFPNGIGGWMSAQGVQKAWRYMQSNEAI